MKDIVSIVSIIGPIICLSLAIPTSIVFDSPAFLLIIVTMGLFSCVYKGDFRRIFQVSFSMNVILGCLLIYSFYSNGSFFSGGGDDEKFYEYFHEARGNSEFYKFRYGHYLFLGSSYIAILNFLGISEVSPLLVYPLNWFIGANVCGLTLILSQQLGLNRQNAIFSSFLLSIYPNFIMSEIRMLREIVATLVLISFLIVYFSKSYTWLKIILLFLLLFAAYRVRGEYIIYMLLFVGIDKLIKLYYNGEKVKAMTFVGVGILISVIAYGSIMGLTDRADLSVADLSQAYNELRSMNVEESLGAKLKTAGPIFLPIVSLYLWLSPFPPPFFFKNDLVSWIVSFGAVFWYKSFIMFPLLLYYSKNSKVNVVKILLFIATCTLIISATSADDRHISSFYPLIFIAYAQLSEGFRSKRQLSFISWIGAILLFFLYFIIKII